MSGVSEFGVECPVCSGNFAHTDLECRTNERTLNCERCGFYSETQIVERAGRKFWQSTMQMPMSEDGNMVAWPPLRATLGGEWNEKDFRPMSGFDRMPEPEDGFSIEAAE